MFHFVEHLPSKSLGFKIYDFSTCKNIDNEKSGQIIDNRYYRFIGCHPYSTVPRHTLSKQLRGLKPFVFLTRRCVCLRFVTRSFLPSTCSWDTQSLSGNPRLCQTMPKFPQNFSFVSFSSHRFLFVRLTLEDLFVLISAPETRHFLPISTLGKNQIVLKGCK
jgi:hypothetical protein